MKSVLLRWFFTGLVIVSTGGCSHQWREASPDYSTSAVLAMLDEAVAGQAVATVAQFREGSMLYFADAPGSLGGVASLLAFNDLGFLGIGYGTDWQSVYRARVFLFDRPSMSGSGHDVALMVGIDRGQGFSYVSFAGQGNVVDDEFVAQMSGTGGAFELRSYDVYDGDLMQVIQFRVYQGGAFIGQFSTLVSYSQ